MERHIFSFIKSHLRGGHLFMSFTAVLYEENRKLWKACVCIRPTYKLRILSGFYRQSRSVFSRAPNIHSLQPPLVFTLPLGLAILFHVAGGRGLVQRGGSIDAGWARPEREEAELRRRRSASDWAPAPRGSEGRGRLGACARLAPHRGAGGGERGKEGPKPCAALPPNKPVSQAQTSLWLWKPPLEGSCMPLPKTSVDERTLLVRPASCLGAARSCEWHAAPETNVSTCCVCVVCSTDSASVVMSASVVDGEVPVHPAPSPRTRAVLVGVRAAWRALPSPPLAQRAPPPPPAPKVRANQVKQTIEPADQCWVCWL